MARFIAIACAAGVACATDVAPGHGKIYNEAQKTTPELGVSTNATFTNLVWADEFNNGIGPDWVYETGNSGWGNNELQYYTQQNAYTDNGNLVIVAKRENYGSAQYTSARLNTQGRRSWKFGRMEARISVPVASGMWPAFWMLGDTINSVGWPSCGELDIMETVNTDNRNYGTAHWYVH